MYTASLSGKVPGTIPTKKYPGNRAYHKGSYGSAPKHEYEKPYVANDKSGAGAPSLILTDENIFRGMEEYRLHEAV